MIWGGRSLAVLLLLLAPLRALAQPSEEPWRMTEEQRRDAGWEWEESGGSGSGAGGALALTVGTLVHGIGHLYSGDERTGRILLIGEAVGVGLLATGVLLDVLTDNDSTLALVYRTFIPLGGSLFIATWLLDVIGTFKGGDSSLPPHMGSIAQIRIEAGYRHLIQPGLDFANITDFRLDLDLGAFFLHPRAQVGINNGYLLFGTSLGMRFGLGRRTMSLFEIQLDFDEVLFRDAGFAYETLLASVALSLDLGDAIAHLDGIVYSNRIGLGAQLYRFDFDGAGPLNGGSVVSMLVVESSLSANVADPLLLEVGYVQRPDTLVGNASRTIGSFFGRVVWAFASAADLDVRVQFGRGVELFASTAVHFGPWSSE